MTKTNHEALTVRLDVLFLALQETTRALAPARAARAADAIRMRLADLTAAPITQTADEGLTAERVPLLAALGSPAQVAGAATRPC